MEIVKDICVNCETCIEVCPVSAISYKHNKMLIDNDICIACGACLNVCPLSAIKK